jgi:hypothetical protein
VRARGRSSSRCGTRRQAHNPLDAVQGSDARMRARVMAPIAAGLGRVEAHGTALPMKAHENHPHLVRQPPLVMGGSGIPVPARGPQSVSSVGMDRSAHSLGSSADWGPAPSPRWPRSGPDRGQELVDGLGTPRPWTPLVGTSRSADIGPSPLAPARPVRLLGGDPTQEWERAVGSPDTTGRAAWGGAA